MILSIEQFKPIRDWPNYMISNHGEVLQVEQTIKRKAGIVKPCKASQKGYLQVQLIDGYTRKFFYVHKLVAQAFIPNPNKYPKVNHIDANHHNNHYKNLEWCTQKQNVHHALNMRMHPHGEKFIEKRPVAIQMIKDGYGTKEIADVTGYAIVSISRLKKHAI